MPKAGNIWVTFRLISGPISDVVITKANKAVGFIKITSLNEEYYKRSRAFERVLFSKLTGYTFGASGLATSHSFNPVRTGCQSITHMKQEPLNNYQTHTHIGTYH